MERLVMNKLVEWKKKKNRKPLILNGARQVGKTWLLKEFGKLHYEDVKPIEVKAEGNVRSNSLSEYLNNNPEIRGIRYSMLPYIQQEHFDNIPLWAIE